MGIARPLTSPPHKIGGLFFNGRDAYVDCGNDESLDITDEITIEVWLNPQEIPLNAAYGFVGHEDYKNWMLYCWVDDIYFRYINTTEDTQFPHLPNKLTTGWQHIVAVWTDSDKTVRVYIDGVYEGSDTGTGSIKSTDFTRILIGAVNPTERLFNGLISSVRIYNRALSEEEIQLLYANPDYPLTDGLVLWLPMNEHSGNTVYDLSGYGNHGTIYNAEWAVRAVEHPLHAV
ncbi:MAG: hypothetical protein DRJ47_06230 [Thermoprotei archaeon]|nr:MAG: hypothetical protein DRJ47_06230 [Thermoprotei archaeon]